MLEPHISIAIKEKCQSKSMVMLDSISDTFIEDTICPLNVLVLILISTAVTKCGKEVELFLK
jgi:hypothetical protein